MYGVVPPLTDAVIVIGWPSSKVFVAAGEVITGILLSTGLIVNNEVAVCVTFVLAESNTLAVKVVEHSEVNAEFEVNTIVLEPSALSVFVDALNEPHKVFDKV